ncbi:MAG: tetratricopeptide repeat protein [Fibrobacterota bacterium]
MRNSLMAVLTAGICSLFLVSCAQITVLRTEEMERIAAQERDSILAVYTARMDSLERVNRRRDVVVNDMLRRLENELDRMSNNIHESNIKMSAIAQKTGVLTEHWEEKARQDSLQRVLEENRRRALFEQAEKSFENGDFENALDDFVLYRNEYPESEEYKEALFKSGKAQYELERYDEAEELFLKIFEEHDESSFAPSALYQLAQLYEEQDRGQRSDFIREQLTDRYPDSEAAQRIVDEE